MIGRDESLRLFGTTESVVDTVEFKAGRLRCDFAAGAVRRLWWDEIEVLRGIAYLVRDRDWGTAPAAVHDLTVNAQPDRFEINFGLVVTLAGATLTAHARINGRDDGTFQFDVTAAASDEFWSSRCGFVLLHPAECAGRALSVAHGNGQHEETEFPRLINPGQPVFDIRGLTWSASQSVSVQCRLRADLPGRTDAEFEMEDQRNWTDASFKTYVGSLLNPWPYLIEKGVSLTQRVELKISDRRGGDRAVSQGHDAMRRRKNARSEISFGPSLGVNLPVLGLGAPHLATGPTPADRQAVIDLRPSWLVVQAELARDDLLAHLATFTSLASAAGADIQLDVLCPPGLTPDACADQISKACSVVALSPEAVRFCPEVYLKSYQPTDRWPDVPGLNIYAQAARSAFPRAKIGGGMITNFAELNRRRQSSEAIDFIGHSSCPIIHAADDISVMETLSVLPHIVTTIRHVWPGLGWRVGPAALAAASNPYGSTTTPNPLGLRLPLAARDPRHGAQFGAAWCAGFAAAVAPLGVELLSLLESHGPRGLVAAQHHMNSEAAMLIPAWRVLRWLAVHCGEPLVQIVGLPINVAGLAVIGKDAATINTMLVNLSAAPCEIELVYRPSASDSGLKSTSQRVELGPYDVFYL
jgi:hypothetical protein